MEPKTQAMPVIFLTSDTHHFIDFSMCIYVYVGKTEAKTWLSLLRSHSSLLFFLTCDVSAGFIGQAFLKNFFF